jgi:hypothetical protein
VVPTQLDDARNVPATLVARVVESVAVF